MFFFDCVGKLPNGSHPKHLQTLCDGEWLSPTSDVDLIKFIREGYDVQCQMRPCSSIFSGPVMLEWKNYRDSMTRLLNCLLLKTTHSSLVSYQYFILMFAFSIKWSNKLLLCFFWVKLLLRLYLLRSQLELISIQSNLVFALLEKELGSTETISLLVWTAVP